MKKTKYVLPVLGENILEEAETSYKQNRCFTDEILLKLFSIYSTSLEKALEILDRTKIVRYVCSNSKRSLYAIGKRDKQFRLFENPNFCFCETFRKDVLEYNNLIMCEHVLALKLAKITGGFNTEEMNDLHFVELLKMMSETI
ncbi:hypothetical protein Trydic_g3725 [Trypoxylus dichotomus]